MKLVLLIAAAAPLGFAAREWRSHDAPLSAGRASPDDEDEKKKKETEAERKVRKSKELLVAQGTRETQTRAVDKMLENFGKLGLPPEFSERFKARFDLEELMDMTAEIYAEHLDEETLDGAIAFYATTAGKAFAAAMPDITEAATDAGMKYGERIGREVAEEIRGK